MTQAQVPVLSPQAIHQLASPPVIFPISYTNIVMAQPHLILQRGRRRRVIRGPPPYNPQRISNAENGEEDSSVRSSMGMSEDARGIVAEFRDQTKERKE